MGVPAHWPHAELRDPNNSNLCFWAIWITLLLAYMWEWLHNSYLEACVSAKAPAIHSMVWCSDIIISKRVACLRRSQQPFVNPLTDVGITIVGGLAG